MSWITTRTALDMCREAGLGRENKGICLVTLLRIARRIGAVKQPAGKRGECFINGDKLKAFLKEGDAT